MSDTQTPEVPQVVKAGEAFTLGWSYYNYRAFIAVALQDFNLYEKLYAYWERTRGRVELDFPIDLEEGFAEFVKELSDAGLVKEIKPVVEFIPGGSSCSTYVSEIFTAGASASENQAVWKEMADPS